VDDMFCQQAGEAYMRRVVLVLCLSMMFAACSKTEQMTSADRKYFFFVDEIENFNIEIYRHELTPDHIPYILFKSFTEQTGFRGLYGTILINPAGKKVKYLCLVNILPTTEQARALYGRMSAEPSPLDIGDEEILSPLLYQTDEVYLFKGASRFHMVLRSSRVVYTILIDGVGVEETQVRSGLSQKMAYLKNHLNTIH